MSAQEKYQSLLEMANQNGTTYELSEGNGVLTVTGTAPSAEAKQQLWDEYNRLDPDFRSGDLILNINTGGDAAGGGANTYTVESGDSLSKIGSKYGIPWKAIWDANRDILHDPDKIYPGQELKIPS
ncbi:MAG TPA: LysM peptidoglycan-binding domain-containing protein [Pyrinomonadaceae bacterium]|jgi:nucleoid-associated protein YgaU|nr:LysM peptidoglycan-binding domain-containing protein [Pyrinomonadaceae bacterium]